MMLRRRGLFLNNNQQPPQLNQQRIVISRRNDGRTATGMPAFVRPWVSNCPKELKCVDGTDLPFRTIPSLVTGTSAYKNEILIRQIAKAVCDGYTPIVLSSNGRQGEVFEILQNIYPESAINYISESVPNGRYEPFKSIPHRYIVNMLCQIIATSQQNNENRVMIGSYTEACVEILILSGHAVEKLILGRLDHMGLLGEIDSLYRSSIISRQKRILLANAANSAQSVSVQVFSILQDYLCKMQNVLGLNTTMQTHNANIPRINILNVNGQVLPSLHNLSSGVADGYNLSNINEGKCLFIEVDNYVHRCINDLPDMQCFQWYISRTLQMELNAKLEIQNCRILLIIEDISSYILKWFSWLTDLPNCVLLLSYEDYYSKLSDSQELRQQLIGRMNRMYFFSVLDEQSAGWVSRILGTHMVPKVVVTEQPYRNWVDIFIRPKTYAHDEVERPWFNAHEIQHLGDKGIVCSTRDKIFKACYCENGKIYRDQNYKRQCVNFCLFNFC